MKYKIKQVSWNKPEENDALTTSNLKIIETITRIKSYIMEYEIIIYLNFASNTAGKLMSKKAKGQLQRFFNIISVCVYEYIMHVIGIHSL